MRTIIICLTTIVCFMLFPGFAIGKKVEVRLKVNEELIYEFTVEEFLITEEGTSFPDQVRTIRYSYFIEKIENNKVFFTAQILENKAKLPGQGPSVFEDTGFPQLVNSLWADQSGNLNYEILYQKKFRFELDMDARTIQFINRTELLAQFDSTLAAKGYSEESRLNHIKGLNLLALKNPEALFLFPFQFLNSDIDQVRIRLQNPDIAFKTVKRNSDQMELFNTDDSLNRTIRCILNLQHGLVTNYITKTVRKSKNRYVGHALISKVQTINQVALLHKSFRKPQRVIICGHIENPVGNQMVLYTLNKGFGSDLDSKTVLLDQSGNFKIETKLVNSGLVIVSNPNKNQNIPGPVILLYASPGDSLYLQGRLKQKQYHIKNYTSGYSISTATQNYVVTDEILFSGDRKKEAELLNQFQQQLGLPPFQILRTGLYVKAGITEVKTYLDALHTLERLVNGSQEDLNPESLANVEHELQAFLYTNLFASRVPEMELARLWTTVVPVLPANMKVLVQSLLDTLNINRIYNDFGLFSRSLTREYVRYKLYRLAPVNNSMIGSVGFSNIGRIPEPEQYIQFTKLVLYGSPLYREVANQLYNASLDPLNRLDYSSQWMQMVDETFELMIKRCNDEAFITSLKNIRNTQSNWNNIRFVPDTRFLNLQKQNTSLRSFLTKKPTVFYASDDWSVGRYDMDELVPKYPEINFVLINGGSNYDLWKDWNDRAEPKAHQLFMLTDTVKVEAVFLNKFQKYVVYNRLGERIGVEENISRAIRIAMESLKSEKNELNKSTLKGIILLLSVSLFLFLVVFIIYKYRMRSRMKKQEQEKRLRELQMAAIRAQMNPHFLFNSLNSVQNLIQQNKNQEAHLYLSDFAGLIRKVLRNSDKEEVSLAEELEMVEQYLKLEKLRFDFNFEVNVEDGIDPHNTMVPSILLQPFAENAVIHGLQNKLLNRQLKINITRKKPGICISIEDNGIGREESQKIAVGNNGKSTNMIKERLAMLQEKQGEKYQFEITDLDDGPDKGTRVEILIPDEV